MSEQAASDSSKKDKKPSPSKGSGAGGKKGPKVTMFYHYLGDKPMEMALFYRLTGFANFISVDEGGTVDIDISGQPKSVTEVVEIGERGSTVNVMTSGETQRIASTINIRSGSAINVAMDVKIRGAADAINIEPGSTINIVTRPVDNRCYQGKLNDRSKAVRLWAAFIATAGMVQVSTIPGPQGAATSTETVQENSEANTTDAQGGGVEVDKEEAAGCGAQ